MDDQEDLRHLVELNHKQIQQIQRQFQEMQAQINRLHEVVYSGSLGKDSNSVEISPFYRGWRRYLGTLLWTLVIVGLIIGCGWNLREILQDMIESPTVTKMTYTFHDKLPLPPISVYQSGNTPMLHTNKLFKALENGSLTEAYLEGIIEGVDIGFLSGQNITVQPREITEAYKQALLQYGSLTEAGLAFQSEYGIDCDELFIFCMSDLSGAMNCCDIFELLWGFNGPQYALKWNTIFLGTFSAFRVRLRSLPNMKALQKGDFVDEPGNYQSYWIGINNGVDQTGYDTHTLEVHPSDVVYITLRQKRRNLKTSEGCADVPPKLRYFRDYTIPNCYFERCTLDKLSLCNISCQIPLLQLLSPGTLNGPPCEFDAFNSMCRGFIKDNQPQCSTTHGCRFLCNHTEIEYGVTRGPKLGDMREILLYFQYDTTEVQMFEETSRLTLWEYLGLTSRILDLWLGITIYSLYRMLYHGLSKITYFKSYNFELHSTSAAAHSASSDQQREMANLSNTERPKD